MAGRRKRTEQFWQVTQWHDRATQSTGFCTSREGAIKVSYQAFVSGEGFPETLVTPDQVTIRIDDEAEENEGAQGHESLSTLWDQWLQQHPEERAAWDTGPRRARLQTLEQQHHHVSIS